jgi:hypothetical protein
VSASAVSAAGMLQSYQLRTVHEHAATVLSCQVWKGLSRRRHVNTAVAWVRVEGRQSAVQIRI